MISYLSQLIQKIKKKIYRKRRLKELQKEDPYLYR
jgi:hypothetical protein